MSSKILQILKEITSIFAYSQDNKKILSKVTAILSKRLNCEVCSIYAYDPESDELILAASYGLNQEIVGKFKLKPGQGITGTAFEKNEILNIVNPEMHPCFAPAFGSGEEKFKSMLSCPLVIGGRKYGVINLQSSELKPFDEDLIDLIRALSIQIANIIESSKVFEPIKLRHQEEEREFFKGVIKGIPANEGLAVGKLVFLDRDYEKMEYLEKKHNSHAEEMKILSMAVYQAKKETAKMAERALEMISEADASIFSVHLLFLEDKCIFDKIHQYIRDGFSAEYSVKKVCDEYILRFEKMNSEVFREKAADLKDVMMHLIKQIQKIKGYNLLEEKKLPDGDKCIIAARELMPSDILRIPIANIAGYISERGGVTAHFAILARALNIPAMMGVSDLYKIKEGENVILDCYAGNIYINPDKETEEKFIEIIKSKSEARIKSDPFEAITKDGVRIYVNANLSLLSEIPIIKNAGADGIGLYRTEFLYMIRDYPPSEENQYKIYSRICKSFENQKVTFRLLDAGSDKPLSYLKFSKEENPSMGIRGIRLFEENRSLFRTQIAAIMRAGENSEIRILIPMASTIKQILSIKEIIAELSSDFSKRGIGYNVKPELGIMIEVPSVIFSLEDILSEIDFASIGTNDLLQFFYASDRTNEKLNLKDSFYEPSFLKLLDMIGKLFKKQDKSLCICG
ncbi:MAG TPA: phosphoenolpyruvate--protein phosphotransferase, partial [Victivallales bacterium]|nr:phosphoenolpyruvate--protein phosphotransferase [Victivallales bacterium]